MQFSFKSYNEHKPLKPLYDFVIIGGGPASLNAALYALRKGMSTLLIAKKMGGQLLDTDSVENYLGLNGQSGESLASAFESHVNTLELDKVEDVVVSKISKPQDLFEINLEDGQFIQAKTVLLATGSNPKKLGVEGEELFANAGVAYCAICDAPLFKGKEVFIAGGGNSAVEAVIDVAKFAAKVILVHRSQLRADKILVDRMMQCKNVEVRLETQILEIFGQTKMEGIHVLNKHSNQKETLYADGIFIEIGHLPKTELVKDWVALNDKGEVMVDAYQSTNIKGLFAAGDVTNSVYKQIIIAVADGAKAALAANDYIHIN